MENAVDSFKMILGIMIFLLGLAIFFNMASQARETASILISQIDKTKYYDYVKNHGLRIDSCDGDFVLNKVDAYHSTSEMPTSDVVLVGLKSVNNHLLPDMLRPIINDDTIVVLIQNGIGLEKDLQKQ